MQLCLSKSWGGLEMSAIRYSELLSEHGHESVCACLKDSPLAKASNQAALKTLLLPKSPRLWPFGSSLRLRAALREHQIDVVFVHHLKDLVKLLPALIGLNQVKLVGLSHVLVSRSKKDIFHRFIYSFLSKMIVFTKIQKDLSIPVLPVPPERYEVIPGFVDTKVFHSSKRNLDLRRSWNVSPDEILIGAIGRLDEQKGQAEFLEALAIVKSEAPELKWKAVLIGAVTASEEKKGYPLYIQSLLEDLHLRDRVQLLGFLPDPSEAMASLDLFVLPSYKETFGLVILEAMASHVVPIVTDAGGPPEIIGNTGLRVEPKNKQALANAILEVLKHPSRREELAKAAEARATSVFSRNAVGLQLHSLLRSL